MRRADIRGMAPVVMLPRGYQSRYGLLGAFTEQIGRAFASEGWCVNPAPSAGGASERVFLFFNSPPSLEALYSWAGAPGRGGAGRSEGRGAGGSGDGSGGGGRRRIIQWCVDHPLTIPAWLLDAAEKDPDHRLLLVSEDDRHLVNLRWPGVRVDVLRHGVDAAALCDAEQIEATHAARASGNAARDIDVLMAGSVASVEELAGLRVGVPTSLHGACEELVRLRLGSPALSFGEAYSLAMPGSLWTSDPWRLMSAVFVYTTAAVNRLRRGAIIRALDGLDVGLLGCPALRELATGTARYLGEARFDRTSAVLARAKVCVALGPTQFVLGHSERLLMSMGAGCATMSDRRPAIAGWDAGNAGVAQFDVSSQDRLRETTEELLGDHDRRAAMGRRGRETVAGSHLWGRRVRELAAALGMEAGPVVRVMPGVAEVACPRA